MPPTILIADDDQDFVKVLRERLMHEGYAILEAYEGVRAVEVAHGHHPDLIILDINMPAGTGTTVLERLRAKPDTALVPVLILTGVDDPQVEATVRDAGANDFVCKPYNSDDLLLRIDMLIQGGF
jgi:two-component system, LuxR family, sensor kinase FixL